MAAKEDAVQARVAELSRSLRDLLVQRELRRKPPEGMARCPKCGAAITPTRTRRIRTHIDPLAAARCDASRRPWTEYGKRAPRGKKPAAA